MTRLSLLPMVLHIHYHLKKHFSITNITMTFSQLKKGENVTNGFKDVDQ